jgi:transposase
LNSFLIVFVWPLICFFAGMIVHRWMTRKQRELLKRYRQQALMLRQWNRPIE